MFTVQGRITAWLTMGDICFCADFIGNNDLEIMSHAISYFALFISDKCHHYYYDIYPIDIGTEN